MGKDSGQSSLSVQEITNGVVSWVLRREVVSMVKDDVGEAEALASKHFIYPGM